VFSQVNHVWHFWLAVAVGVPVFLGVIAWVGLYIFKVSRTRYPHQ
jgi:hypothetical protein